MQGKIPDMQEISLAGVRYGKKTKHWLGAERDYDLFDVKSDLESVLKCCKLPPSSYNIKDASDINYYHPGKSGRIFLNKDKDKIVGYFGEIHPNIIKKIDIKTEALVGFEIFVDNLKKPQKLLKDQKKLYQVSDFQKSERDFAFIIDKNFKSQELIDVISNVNSEIISNVDIFDVYEGENTPSD